ncbi:hybrid sensor histidine kinase/response regulator [Polyangium sorediatum]|uniref:histidine kinase n=1 Tax=Polyangium sorediatum TaxID=889274 RepID=A0ABT6P4I4_9BACT|nr:response regulator [Polyangium sorediatum]MDI1435508.1 response regulator [Polyangium sorediatum]
MKHARDKVGILVVDDRRDRLLAVETMLAELGERVVLAQSGRDALRFLLQEDFAVILLDVDMPIMDGFETARLIRQRKRSRQTPIIFLTAFGDAIQAEQGYALGAVDYMLVPVDSDILRAKVSVFVELYRKTEEANLATQAIAKKAGQLAALARASLSINGARSLEAMLDAIASGARAALGARSSFVALVSGSKHGTAASSAGGVAAPRTVPVDPANDWIFTRVATAGSVVTLSASERAQRDPERADEPGPLMAVPLVGSDGTCVGWIEVTNGEADGFREDDESLLLLSAQLASVALQNLLHAEEREVSRLKDEFLATLSHELRTPLTAIIGWTRILRETQPDAAKLARGLEVIDRNAGAQNKLIEDLLDVSRIVTGKMSMEQRQVRLAPLVEASVDALRPAAQAKDITLVVVCSAGKDSALGDPERLRQVATNLLSNAIKFTPRGGRIEVRLRRVGDELELAIADNGEGIRPDFLPYVFDRFRQGDSSSRRMHGGLGIGLAVVRHIVVSHGGTVSAHSEGPRLGSTFTVRLPSAFLPREAEGPTPPPYGKPRLPLPDLSGLRVLVVDDDQDTREILRQVLAAHRADVRIAATVREAIAELDAARPHVLVSDIAMPGEDGYDFIDFVRRRTPERGGAVPALALTAHARAEDQARALAAGFQRHAAKPIDPAELVRAIAGLVGAPCSRLEPVEAVALREVP